MATQWETKRVMASEVRVGDRLKVWLGSTNTHDWNRVVRVSKQPGRLEFTMATANSTPCVGPYDYVTIQRERPL